MMVRPSSQSMSLRPGFVLAFVLGAICAGAYGLAPPLLEKVSEAMERRQARAAQLATAKGVVAQRGELARRVGVLEQAVDEGALFQKGLNADAMQATLRSAASIGGVTIRALNASVEPIGENRQRLTCRLSLEGTAEAVNAALTQIEAVQPRLLLREVHVQPAITDGLPTLILDLEIDAYADLANP
ncbi:GspMb/PilO family protein [Azospirillum sp. B4]|uniref:GspMb/PilO family protein n=1 Tax=Azospirillum sp. B4 TaxID=95605 RepID=UPI000A01E868|nr:GspMb/PilO family protein [Azospirillum sp. B4]